MEKNISRLLGITFIALLLAGCASQPEEEKDSSAGQNIVEIEQKTTQIVEAPPVEQKKDETSIQKLILEGKSNEAQALFQAKIDVNNIDDMGNTPLHAAAQVNDSDLVRFLILKGADTEIKNKAGDTPLHIAIKNRSVRSAEILGSASNVFSKDGTGKTALELGMEEGTSFFDALITKTTAELKDANGRGIVHYFASTKNQEAIDDCIRKELPLSQEDNNGATPLSICYENNNDIDSIRMAASLILADATPIRGLFSYFEDAVKTRNPSMRFDDGQTPLHLATILGQTGVAQYLIERGASTKAKDVSGATPLHEAVRYGRTEIARYLLEAGADPNAQDSLGKTPMLIITPQDSRAELYTMLLNHGSNPNAKDLYGDTPLHIATITGMTTTIIEKLIKAGADINERNKKGVTPLSLAVEHKWAEHISYFARCGADIHAEDMEGNTPLTRALDSGFEIISKLINSNNCTSRDSYGNTPLHIAIQKNANAELIKYIIDKGADVNARNRYGDSPLYLAVQKNFRAAGEQLLAHQADVFATNTENLSPLKLALTAGGEILDWILSSEIILASDGIGNTPLHYAAEWKLDSSVAVLLEKGANPNIQNSNGETPLFFSVKSDSPSTIQLLLDKGADKNMRDFLGNTTLHACVRWDSRDAAKKLIANGVSINAQNISGKTPLHEAAKAGRTVMVELLLSNGADINATDTTGKTVLIDALQSGNTELVKMLINKGASPHIQEMYGRNAYHEAAESGSIELINIIRNAGGNPLSRDSYGKTPFSLVLDKDESVIKAVLGSDMNLSDSDGNTPIHIAVMNRITPQKLSMLLSLKYPVNRRNSTGQTPLSIAVESNYQDTARILLENGADPFLTDNSGNCAVSIAIEGRPDILNSIVTTCGNARDMAGDGILHYAARTADEAVIKKLLSMGLDPNNRNITGETAHDIAIRWQRPAEIIELLK
ncbi:MAG: ankyrin repeat domain-containing protein [Treponemataceae bacterium]|nr:ankyrin repeat domain-containing protein [Treponemataceae bacterium]